jgi:hypothetical protein
MATLKASTGLRDAMLDSDSLRGAMEGGNGGCIRVYSGTPPATADDAVTGTLLLTITTSGITTGTAGSTLILSAPSGGVVSKEATAWTGTAVATGVPTYFRHVASLDDGTLSTTQKRIQGDVGLVGAVLNFGVSTLTSGVAYPIDACNYRFPTL